MTTVCYLEPPSGQKADCNQTKKLFIWSCCPCCQPGFKGKTELQSNWQGLIFMLLETISHNILIFFNILFVKLFHKKCSGELCPINKTLTQLFGLLGFQGFHTFSSGCVYFTNIQYIWDVVLGDSELPEIPLCFRPLIEHLMRYLYCLSHAMGR